MGDEEGVTVGWIREGDEDRFYEAMSKVPGPTPWCPPPERCPFCQSEFPDTSGLYAHLRDAHVLPRPALLLAGSEPKAVDMVVTQLSPDDIIVANCGSAGLGVDGRAPSPVDVSELRSRLSSIRDGAVWIRLASAASLGQAPVQQEYRLKMRVASEEELKNVDRAFVRWFGTSGPHISAVDHFMAEIGSGPWREYAEALTDYVIGVLHKDKDPATGVRPPYKDYAQFYRRSHDVLVKCRRPLPYLLASLIRFALNDFSRVGVTGFIPLDIANSTLGPLAVGGKAAERVNMGNTPTTKAVCPVDSGTGLVLFETHRAVTASRWSAVEEEAMVVLDGRCSLGALDAAKLRAVFAWNAVRLGQRRISRGALERLIANDCFSKWAEAELEKMDD